MIKIIEMLIPEGNKFTRPGIKMTPTSITIHETGNTNLGANALAHAKLQLNGNRRQASWHFQVDDGKEVYLSIPLNEVAYHAGHKDGNYSSIAIEICVNQDGNYKEAVKNAAKVVRYIMKKYPHIKKSDIKQHYDWTKKNCPQQLRNGSIIKWSEFLNLIDNKKVIKASQPNSFKTGEKVILSEKATHYATGEKIPTWVKGKTYTIQQTKGSTILLKEIYSWVRKSDVIHVDNDLKGNLEKMFFVGQKVTIKRSANTYSRSTVTIPNKYKGKRYTIQQVSTNDVLIKELYSWVKKKDIV